MDSIKIFKTTYGAGNRDIMMMTTRSLMSSLGERRVFFDPFRYKNEISLYRLLSEKSFASITSSLIPIIISNESLEAAREEATKLFEFIRKSASKKNKVGITMLCHFLFNLGQLQDGFADFTMDNGSKEDEIEFQKQKINIILGKKSIIDVIVESLEEIEPEHNKDLLKKLESQEISSIDNEAYKAIEDYFIRLCNFETSAPKIEKGFQIHNIINVAAKERGFDPFIGKFLVKENDKGIIKLECKRGDLTLLIDRAVTR